VICLGDSRMALAVFTGKLLMLILVDPGVFPPALCCAILLVPGADVVVDPVVVRFVTDTPLAVP